MGERGGRTAKQNKCHKTVPGSYNDFKKKGEKNGELVWKEGDKERQ